MRAVERGKAEFGLVVDGDVIAFLFRFSGVEQGLRGIPWSDSPYTWQKLRPGDQQILPTVPEEMTEDTQALLQVFFVNADTGILLAMRQVTLAHEFTVQLHRAILKQVNQPFDEVRYDRQVRALQASYQESEDMLRVAIARCEGDA